MPRLSTHPLALFSLQPKNKRAMLVVSRQENEAFVSKRNDGTLALDIGHICSKAGRNTLAVLGRGNAADIYVEGSSIAKIQCSFEIDPATNVVMLYDQSNKQTTQVFGDNATPFEDTRPRKVVVQRGLNTIIGMGGSGCDLVQFELFWRQHPDMTIGMAPNRECNGGYGGYEVRSRLARTVDDEADTILPSRREITIHPSGSSTLKIRYATIGGSLGAGQYGVVYKAVDADSGRLMAVKVIKEPQEATELERDRWREYTIRAVKREVEALAKINHPHILDYIASQGDLPHVEVFMGLKEGNLLSLVDKGVCLDDNTILHHMLQALDCLAVNGIIHRDVKPENILYVTQPDGQYQFQLGDFGLCNNSINVSTFAGTHIYLAPEVQEEEKQTHKVDVWSLFVTMLWVLDVRAFRHECQLFKAASDIRRAVLAASNEQAVTNIRPMAIINPEARASASQMLVQCFDGVGLSTPLQQVPPLFKRSGTCQSSDFGVSRPGSPKSPNRQGLKGEELPDQARSPS